jgi:ABC-type multidrug transport system fused ATPase/permease subunit
MLKISKLLNLTEKKKIIYIIFFIILLGICETLTFFFLQPILNYFNTDKYDFKIIFFDKFLNIINSSIFILVALFLIFFILRSLITIFLSYQRSQLTRMINDNLSKRLYSHYLFQDFQFYINNNSSNFISNIVIEVEKFSYRIIDCLIAIIAESFVILGILIFLLTFYFYVSVLLFLISLSFFLICYYFYKNKFQKIGYAKVISDAKKIDNLQKSFYAIQNVKLDHLENFFINKFQVNTEESSRSYFMLQFLSDLPKPIIEFFIMIVMSILIFFVYYFFNFNKQDIFAMLGIFAIAMFRLLPSFNRIFNSLNQLKYHSSTTDIILDFFKKNPKPVLIESKEEYSGLKESIVIDNVSFKYDLSNDFIFENIHLIINKNEVIGICGDSGSGKSTLLNIITFLLKPTSGKILVDKKPLESIYKLFQSRIGYVPQKTYLIDGTVIENIIFGQNEKSYDHDLFNSVIVDSNLKKFIDNMPEKEKTYIGERGTRLSGGQQQRIGIARALYKKPDILILDEATNALDEDSEREIFNTIDNFKNKITIIIVSHNKSVLENADKVYKIEHNKLTQVK